MAPNRYTELFFRDEATALAAGHRPCAECRRADSNRFKEAWKKAWPDRGYLASDLNAYLYSEQIAAPSQLYNAERPLPNGAMIGRLDEGAAWLIWNGRPLLWSFEGYGPAPAVLPESVVVLTRPSMLGVLDAGYMPSVHRSVVSISY